MIIGQRNQSEILIILSNLPNFSNLILKNYNKFIAKNIVSVGNQIQISCIPKSLFFNKFRRNLFLRKNLIEQAIPAGCKNTTRNFSGRTEAIFNINLL